MSLLSNAFNTKWTLASGLLVLSFFLSGCPKDGSTNTSKPSESPATLTVAGATPFDAERAMQHVRKQVDLGPRPPGTEELAKAREYIIQELKSYGLPVSTDEFSVSTPIGERKMVNVVATIPGESPDTIIISSHYDSKYYKNMRFVGANDPGTSVATLLEIARILASSTQKPKFTYSFVFFDGEEAFCREWEECSRPGAPDNTYGSRRFVSETQRKNEVGRIRSMILLDLMGSKNLELGRDPMSTRWLQDIIWRTGRDLGYGKVFVDRPEGVGGDDHEPFLRAGIDSVDLIQLTGYPYWHKAEDTIDKVSGESMKIVGNTIITSLPRIEEYLQTHKR